MYTIAFDLGKVLFDFDYNIALNKLKGKMNCKPESIIREIYENNFGLDFEKGLLTGNEFYDQFKKDYQLQLDYAEFVKIWTELFWPIKETIALADKLKNNYPLYLISNINELHFGYLAEEFPQVFTFFKKLILSYEVKSVKPEKEIYQALQKACQIDFSQIIYIDDRVDLIEAAKKLGIKALQFTGYQQLIEDLGKFGVGVDPRVDPIQNNK